MMSPTTFSLKFIFAAAVLSSGSVSSLNDAVYKPVPTALNERSGLTHIALLKI
jgi:hypothetical protein